MKRLILLTVALISMLLATQAVTISFSTPNKPATWAKMIVTANGQPIESGANVEVGTTVVFTADEGIGFHIEWIVNGVKDESTTEGTFSKVISEDTNVEAHYVEHFKFVFKGTPFVKYADAQGVIYTGCNAYFHRGDKQRAFGYSVSMFVRSLGDTIRPDNIPYDTLYIRKDTLKSDVEITPIYTLSESDLGDVTATVTWDFTHPDSIGLFRNFQGKCAYPSPTFMESVYPDLNMSIDATRGWIDNEHRLKIGDTQVGAGTRLKIPARYGTTYKIVTRGELSATTIADSTSYTKTIDADGNHVATLLYYASDNDSIDIVIGEDIELLKVSASYPGGDNILEWTPEMKTTKNELVTASKTGEAGCLLFNMSDLTLNGGLKVEAGEPLDSLSAKIEVPNEYDENKYLSVSFQTGTGFSLTLKQAFLQMRLEGANKSATAKLILSDEEGHKLEKLYQYNNADTVLLDTLANLGKPNDISFVGKMTLKVYVYGQANSYRLFMPLTVAGEICEIIKFPEHYNFMPYKAKSEIDKDGTALLTIDCYELVGVDEEEQHVILNAIEEIPMGDVIIVHSDQAGATYHIPLTRADDAYIRGNNKLWVSDGNVKGGKDIYRFKKEDIEGSRYVFENSTAEETLPYGEIYLKYHSAGKYEMFYLDKNDMPEKIENVMFIAAENNEPTINEYRAMTIKEVEFKGTSYHKDHKWNTLCLPFDLVGDNIDNSVLGNAEIWELDVADKPDYITPTGFNPQSGLLTLNFKPARSIESGKPYIFEWRTTASSQIENPQYNNVTIKTTKASEMAVTSSDGRVQFVGTFAPRVLMGNNDANLYMGNNDDIRVPTENMPINAFLAFFLIDLGNGLGMPGPAEVKKAVLNVDGEVITSIITIHSDTQVKGGWYTLDGRKLNGRPSLKGIYINNGRKIVIK